LVKKISVGTITTDAYLSVKVDNFSVAYYLVKGKRGNQLWGYQLQKYGINLMELLVKRGLPFSIPIAEGQKMTIPALDGAGLIQVMYDLYDAQDILPTAPNGTASKKFGFIQYLRETDVITASGDLLLNKAITPTEFPDFPAGRAVPPRMKIKLHGINAYPFADCASENNGFYTSYLKLVREREVLFDEDRNGFPFKGYSAAASSGYYWNGESIIGDVGEVDNPSHGEVREPLFFTPALEFLSGEELNVYLTCVKVGTRTMAVNQSNVALILEVNRD
jgi:hypothetical protein